MIRLRIDRGDATAQSAEQAIAGLDAREGIYFGVDAGIAGLHPLQATLVAAAALRFRVWGDGLEVEALSAFGRGLLAQQGLATWRSRTGRGQAGGALAAARAFLACFEAGPDIVLIGALRFEAHRLAAPAPAPADFGDGQPLGVLYFPERLLRRDASGAWRRLELSLADAEPAIDPELAATPATPQAQPPRQPTTPRDDHPPGGYARMVQRALEVLRQRPLLSLTLSQSYRRAVQRAPSDAFARLRAANPAPASFFINDGSGSCVFGASPDLQLVISDGEVRTLPVCGTVARRPGAQGEADSLRELFNEEVDAAALAVCSDVLRNDLAPLCEPGSLRLSDRRRPMSLATVVHAVDRVAGRLKPGVDAWDAIAATAAPVMLTGAPRALALQAIAELEASPRGWYGGMVVQVASSGDALVGTILRAASVQGGVAEVRTGGDLLADSAPEREEAESRLKARSLWRAFGLEQAATPWAALPAGPSPPIELHAEGDPFEAALRDCLAGLGVVVAQRAPTVLVTGADPLPAKGAARVVAIGDAAYRLLRAAGAQVRPCAAEHGRALACETTSDAPLGAGLRFGAGRYASFELLAPPGAPWRVWACDDLGRPVALARDDCVCLLYRPDSLLSDETARALFAAALSMAQRA